MCVWHGRCRDRVRHGCDQCRDRLIDLTVRLGLCHGRHVAIRSSRANISAPAICTMTASIIMLCNSVPI